MTPRRLVRAQEIYLSEWELIFSYATYLRAPLEDLRTAATTLVDSELAHAAVVSDGSCYWRSGREVAVGDIDILFREWGGTGTVSVPNAGDAFSNRELRQAASLRFSEIKLFGSDAALPVPYIRLVLLPCTLVVLGEDASGISAASAMEMFQPVVKLHATGDLVVSLRHIPREKQQEASVFLSDTLMLRRKTFDAMMVPKRIAQAHGHSYEWMIADDSVPGRWRRNRRIRQLDAELDKRLVEVEVEGRNLLFVPLGLGPDPQERITVAELALTIASAIGYDLARSPIGLRSIVARRKDLGYDAVFWSGRPHVHLVRFSEQRWTASDNERDHGALFGRILAEVPDADDATARRFLTRNLRVYPGVASYTNGASFLSAWSRQGLEREEQLPWASSNPWHFIDEQEVLAELVEYGHVVHRRLLAESQKPRSTEAVLRAQEDLLNWEGAMREASHYGELRDFLRDAWQASGVDQLREQSYRYLGVQQARAAVVDARREAQWERRTTVLFGFLAVPAVATEILLPLWRVLGIGAELTPEALALVSVGLAGLVVVTVLLLFRIGERAD